MAELLLEIGLEEIPARMIAAAEAELARRVEGVLTRARLLDALPSSPATPRRAGWRCASKVCSRSSSTCRSSLPGLPGKQPFPMDSPVRRPRPSPKKRASRLAALEKITTPKGEYAAATVQRPGQSAEKVLSDSLPQEIGALSWPKTMYWRPNKPERFVRPLRWLLCLLD